MSSNRERDEGSFERAGEAMGEMAGRMVGQATDAALNVTGAVFNSVAAMLGQWWSGPEARQAASSFGEQQDSECRRHFEARSSGRDYTTTRPLYQLGHVAGKNPQYRDRSYSDVEPDLRRAWESSPDASRHGRWEDVNAFVEFGFDQGGQGASAGEAGQAGVGGASGSGFARGESGARTSGTTGTGSSGGSGAQGRGTPGQRRQERPDGTDRGSAGGF